VVGEKKDCLGRKEDERGSVVKIKKMRGGKGESEGGVRKEVVGCGMRSR
jgi:hypothetical protein